MCTTASQPGAFRIRYAAPVHRKLGLSIAVRQRPIRWTLAAPGMRILGGWDLSGIVRVQSGQPVTINTPAVNNGQSGKIDNPTIGRWFDTSVFRPAAPFTFGNIGSRSPDIRTDFTRNVDRRTGEEISRSPSRIEKSCRSFAPSATTCSTRRSLPPRMARLLRSNLARSPGRRTHRASSSSD